LIIYFESFISISFWSKRICFSLYNLSSFSRKDFWIKLFYYFTFFNFNFKLL